MLHKSKSKKINLIKYALVIPLLAGFLMSFNTEEVYIEKITEKTTNGTVENKLETQKTINTDTLKIIFNKDLSDKDLEKIKSNLKENNIIFTYSELKRNAKGEIISIATKYETAEGNCTSNVTGNPIKPFYYFRSGTTSGVGNLEDEKLKNSIKESEWKTKSISEEEMIDVKVTGYAKTQDSVLNRKIGNKTNVINNEDELNPWKITIGRNAVSYPDTDTLKWKSTNKRVGLNWVSEEDKKVSLSNKNESNVKFYSSNSKEPLYFIDGKESKKNEMDNLQHYNIESINVLKDDMAIEKYGEKAKNGVIEVTTKKNPRSEWKISAERNTNVIYAKKDTIYVQKKPDLFKELAASKNNQPLYILNGKEISRKELGQLNELNIESVSEIKDSKYAIEKYGEKGKYGVVQIKTRTDNSKTPIVKVIGNAIYILDGKEVKKEVFDKLNPDDIESVNVLKGNTAIKKYGEKAKNGVVEITTKK